MADIHAGLRERGTELRERARQKIAGQLKRDTQPQGPGPAAAWLVTAASARSCWASRARASRSRIIPASVTATPVL